jgi:SNF2 family DNA or RNA helicase
MGLGKSLTIITALHTAMTSPNMTNVSTRKPSIHTVLCVVPANTLINWQNEVQKWTEDLDAPLKSFHLGGVMSGYRIREIKQWKHQGGFMFLGDAMFLKMADDILKVVQPDALVLDEAHTMLKSNRTQTFVKLQQINTKRIILATGTPLQNNLAEYCYMCEFIRPGIFEVSSIKEFEELYRYES